MSNYEMSIEFFGNVVRAQTDGKKVCLNDLFNAGNIHRLQQGKGALQLSAFLNSKGVEEYLVAASEEWNIPKDSFINRQGRGNNTRTYVHISVALLAAETISPKFHAHVHKVFIDGKLLEYRDLGGTEFKNLNAAIDQYLPDRTGSNNTGVFIQVAKLIRGRILGEDAKTSDWNGASVNQTHLRYEWENKLCDMLRLGVVRDYTHLKELIGKL